MPGFNPAFGGPPPFAYGGPPGPGFGQQPPPGAFPPPHQQTPIGPPDQGRPPSGMKAESQPPRQAAAQKPAEMSGTPAPPGPQNVPSDTAQNHAAKAAATQAAAPPKKTANRVAVPLAGAKSAPKPAETKPANKPASYADATHAATAAVAAAMAQLAPSGQAQSDNLTQKVNQMRLSDNTGRGRGRGRGASAPRGGRRDAKPVEVPKEDFDFESSNAKFNKQDLVKQANTGSSPVTSPPANGTDGNVFENGHADDAGDDVVIPPKTTEKSYDRKTSFFDNISSDLKDRSEAQTVDGRAIRSQERTKNMETFGQGSVDGGFRGGFRGRGRGGRGFTRGRGGFQRGYDGQRGGSSGRGRGRGAADGHIAA